MDWTTFPANLPEPTDDGLADHLPNSPVPDIFLTSTAAGEKVNLLTLSRQQPVLLFIYPLTGVPGKPNPEGWDNIPGARGCTPELCSVRDSMSLFQELRRGISIFGLSTQSTSYQSQVASRLHFPYAILSDAGLEFTNGLSLPTFEVDGSVLLKRITLLLDKGLVVKVDYPIFPSDQAAKRAADLIRV
ncbi:hypothetical protein BS47DRAFT_1343799 [Hydnum rufescens UP504]|uniref:Redoxin domain-containing protein n=1 Tax=Hydnum rufescens UP504 TaxID=1448309 RepID=A0A9P6AXF9_9AGAM|nr:hypothetical protein BS47DRAFT_1343799 [Hydnum rufescens UP504]